MCSGEPSTSSSVRTLKTITRTNTAQKAFKIAKIRVETWLSWAYRQNVAAKGYNRAQHIVNVGFKAMGCGLINRMYEAIVVLPAGRVAITFV